MDYPRAGAVFPVALDTFYLQFTLAESDPAGIWYQVSGGPLRRATEAELGTSSLAAGAHFLTIRGLPAGGEVGIQLYAPFPQSGYTGWTELRFLHGATALPRPEPLERSSLSGATEVEAAGGFLGLAFATAGTEWAIEKFVLPFLLSAGYITYRRVIKVKPRVRSGKEESEAPEIRCDLCLGRMKDPAEGHVCACGIRLHGSCAARAGTCPGCGTPTPGAVPGPEASAG
ncbi:MAG: hypothetical protein ACT4PT_02005 [Methanobacteriota archaeon]